MAKRKSNFLTALVLVAVLGFSTWHFASPYLEKRPAVQPVQVTGKTLTASFLDVGQGDAALFRLPDGKTALIDAGDNDCGDALVAYLKNAGVTRLDYLIATHPHADHIGGMDEVISALEIGRIFAPKIAGADVPTTKTYENFLKAVQAKGLKITAATAGSTLFSGNDYTALCLAPAAPNYDELNNYSAVVRISYGAQSFLLTGDAERESEAEMLKNGYDLRCDVLKVGHHGSTSSTSAAFLKAASPTYAVISCGKDNSYGHPHQETLQALSALSGLKKTYRTDVDHTVTFTVNGKAEDGIACSSNQPAVK